MSDVSVQATVSFIITFTPRRPRLEACALLEDRHNITNQPPEAITPRPLLG